jgi:hypothetical protein
MLRKLLLGPELLWLVFYVIAVLLARANTAPTYSWDKTLENLGFTVPLIGIALTFALYWVPGVEHRWLLLRIWIVGLFGAHYVMEKGMKAYSEQGPGIGTAYIMGLCLTLFMLVVGSVVIGVKRLF